MPEIRHLVQIDATPRVVYRAITEQDGLRAWWTPQSAVRPEVGSTAEFAFGARYRNRMRITRLEPESGVEWECLDGDEEWIGTTLRFELEENDGGTMLRFTHGSWREATRFFDSCRDQWGHYMLSLRLYCETGTGTPFDPGGHLGPAGG